MPAEPESRIVLTLSCQDQVGIVSAVAGVIAGAGGWIVDSANFADRQNGRFFMREEILEDELAVGIEDLRRQMEPIARKYEMKWSLSSTRVRKRIAVMVGKQEHCLYDLLGRARAGELHGDIACVISNHTELQDVVDSHGISFVHLTDVKSDALENTLTAENIDVVVLARYMQVIPADVCARFAGKIINIHHSFLPSFKGAKPYHQAHERGVKLIGATCHYVTAELDEGPIIEQDVVRIDHSDSIERLVSNGKDIEKAVLARGLQWHLDDRVLLNGHRTVVFR